MLQKFALAFKTKTIEFFAEDEEDDDDGSIADAGLDSAEEVITGQRVVVIKPDGPGIPTNSIPVSSSPRPPSPHLQRSFVSSLFATVSAFHAAYLQLQTAQEPFNRDAVEDADRAAVSHLQRLSDLKKAYFNLPKSSNSIPLPSHLEAQVQENQSMLRKFETVFNRLQSDIDQKDPVVGALQQELREIKASNSLLERRLKRSGPSDLSEKEKAFVSIEVFDSVLKECCKTGHKFAKTFIGLMKESGWDLDLAANSIYPNVNYAKKGHCKYALLSYICLGMFGGFGSHDFGNASDGVGSATSTKKFLSEFIHHLTVDAVELLGAEPDCEFARFCEKKYRQLIHPDMEFSLFGNLESRNSLLDSWKCSNPLYEPFVLMSSSVWMLHKLALAFDHPVRIFQVAQGADFSIVYMDSVVRNAGLVGSSSIKTMQKVGFTVVPGFHIGRLVIQCRVYLNYTESLL